MTNPYSPRWRPEYDDDADIDDVGTGADGFGAALYDLYKAGRVLLPGVAGTYGDLTTRINRLDGPIDDLFEDVNYHPAHMLLKQLRIDLHDVLRQSTINVAETGQALVEIAASYAVTDEAAAAKVAELIDDDQEAFENVTSLRPAPPAGGAPPGAYHDDGHLDQPGQPLR